MKLLNKITIFVISSSQVVFGANKIEATASKQEKFSVESKKTLAQELREKKLIKTEKSSASTNCLGKLPN